MIHHIAVALHHAFGRVAYGQHCHLVALIDQPVIFFTLPAVPAVRLSAAGYRGFERYVRVGFFHFKHSFGKVHVAAYGHSAYIMPVSRLICPLEPHCKLLFEGGAARIVFIQPPGELCGTMA